MRIAIVALSNALHQAARWGAMGCIIAMLLSMAIQIGARYGFNAPPTWTEEVARYTMVWAGLLGATLSFRNRADAVLLESVLPQRLGWLATAIQGVAVLSFLLPILYFCAFSWRGQWGQGYIGRTLRLTADTLGMSMAWVAMAVPISAAIIVVHLLARWAGPAQSAPAPAPAPAPAAGGGQPSAD